MKIQTRPATAILVLALALGACGGSSTTAPTAGQLPSAAAAQTGAPAAASTPAGSTAAISACALITEPEAKAFLGTDPGPGVDAGSTESPACAYGASLTIVLELTDGKAQFDASTANMQGSTTSQALSGVGDGGYVTIVGNTVAIMEFLKGTTLVTINVQGDPSRQNVTLAALTALGKTVVGRL